MSIERQVIFFDKNGHVLYKTSRARIDYDNDGNFTVTNLDVLAELGWKGLIK